MYRSPSLMAKTHLTPPLLHAQVLLQVSLAEDAESLAPVSFAPGVGVAAQPEIPGPPSCCKYPSFQTIITVWIFTCCWHLRGEDQQNLPNSTIFHVIWRHCMTQHLAPLLPSTPTHHQGPSSPVFDSEASGAPTAAITCKPIAMLSSFSKPMLYCSYVGSWVRKLTFRRSPWNCPFFAYGISIFSTPKNSHQAEDRHPQGMHLLGAFVPSGSARLRSPSHPLCSPPRGARPVWSMPPASGGRSLRVHLGQQRTGRPGFGKAAP